MVVHLLREPAAGVPDPEHEGLLIRRAELDADTPRQPLGKGVRETVGQQLVQQEAAGVAVSRPTQTSSSSVSAVMRPDRSGAGQPVRARGVLPQVDPHHVLSLLEQVVDQRHAWRRPAHLEEAPEPRVVDGALLQAQQAGDDLQVVLDSVGHLPHQDVFAARLRAAVLQPACGR